MAAAFKAGEYSEYWHLNNNNISGWWSDVWCWHLLLKSDVERRPTWFIVYCGDSVLLWTTVETNDPVNIIIISTSYEPSVDCWKLLKNENNDEVYVDETVRLWPGPPTSHSQTWQLHLHSTLHCAPCFAGTWGDFYYLQATRIHYYENFYVQMMEMVLTLTSVKPDLKLF